MHCTESKYLLTDILRNEWGLEEFVISDWDATHSTVPAAKADLDLEMPGIPKYFDNKLVQAARKAIVLLKNKNKILPLNKNKIKTIAVIGPNANVNRIGGGGSSEVIPFYSVSPLDGLKDKLGENVILLYNEGTSIAQKDMPVMELINDIPTSDPEKKADLFYNAITRRGVKEPAFYIFRIVWTSPSNVLESMEILRKNHPELNFEVIDVYNFFHLFKKHYK